MDTSLPKAKVTPKDFFLWLGAMVALYVSATSLILLVHEYISVLFPSELDPQYSSYSGAIRFSIASLVVVFPLYIWFTRLLHTDMRRDPLKKELWVRRWLVYITLFVAGVTMAIDIIWVIFQFLEGELTVRFLLKALTILIILGSGFWYYLAELKGVWDKREGLSVLIGAIVSLVVFGSVSAGFFVIGSPTTERLYKFDEQRVLDLQNIQGQVVQRWQQKEQLPETLAALEDSISGYQNPRDPQTGEAYSYRVVGPMQFELCATFNKASRPQPASYSYPFNVNWEHEEGAFCYTRTIDPEIYPPFTK